VSASDSRFAYCFNFSVLFAASKGTACSVSTKIQGHTPPKVSVLHFVLHFTVTTPLFTGLQQQRSCLRCQPFYAHAALFSGPKWIISQCPAVTRELGLRAFTWMHGFLCGRGQPLPTTRQAHPAAAICISRPAFKRRYTLCHARCPPSPAPALASSSAALQHSAALREQVAHSLLDSTRSPAFLFHTSALAPSACGAAQPRRPPRSRAPPPPGSPPRNLCASWASAQPRRVCSLTGRAGTPRSAHRQSGPRFQRSQPPPPRPRRHGLLQPRVAVPKGGHPPSCRPSHGIHLLPQELCLPELCRPRASAARPPRGRLARACRRRRRRSWPHA
jgi:hypothetical protein